MERSSDSLCRACLTETTFVYPLTNTFSGHEDINFSTMLMSCTSICVCIYKSLIMGYISNLLQIDPDDSLPHSICKVCTRKLFLVYNFKEQCEKSDLFLRTHKHMKDAANDVIIDEYVESDILVVISDASEEAWAEGEIKSEVNKSTDENINSKDVPYIDNKFKPRKIVSFTQRNNAKRIILKTNSTLVRQCINETVFKTKARHKIHKCTECNKQFSTRQGLKYHLVRHAGIKNYMCPIESCKKKFFWNPALKKHMAIHLEEKQFLCDECGKGYKAYDAYKYHLRKHRGERPFLCTYCGKTFMQSVHLTYHLSSHSGKKPFVCNKCNRSYTRPAQLTKHLNKYCGVEKSPPPLKTLL